MTYSTLLFDFDHTLFDSDSSEAGAFARTLVRFGIDEAEARFRTYERINRELWQRVEGGTMDPGFVGTERFVRFVAELDLAVDPIAMADEYSRAMGEHGELYPGAGELLRELASRVTLGLITNGITRIQRARIERLGLDSIFSAVAISEEVGASKPGGAIFDAAFELLDNPPRETTLMIGDSLSSDIRGGSDYGLATCWYNPEGREAGTDDRISHEIRDLAQVLPLAAISRR